MQKPSTVQMQTPPLSRLEHFLRLFSDIRPGEGTSGLMLLLNVFLMLAAYYLIKPVREGWIAVSDVAGLSKMEVKAYSSFGQTLIFIIAIPLYGLLADKVHRLTLITVTTLFLVGNMVIFWLLHPGLFAHHIPHLGIVFYLWVGLFSVTLLAQFWAFAADLYSEERGKRLFPLIAIGASAGAVAGSWFTEKLVRLQVVATFDLILVAIVPLSCALGLTWLVDRRGVSQVDGPSERTTTTRPASADHRDVYRIIFSSRYLLLLAGLCLLINWVNTNGENILFGVVQEALQQQFQQQGISEPAAISRFVNEGTTAFYGNLFFWVNLLGLLLQAFVVSRLLKFGGVGTVLLFTPVIAVLSYGTMALFPVLAVVRLMKIAENASDYSVNNTARHVLWLPVPNDDLYKAKAGIDTICVRVGDGLAALTVLVGSQLLTFSLTTFLHLNVLLALTWVMVAVQTFRENRRLLAADNGRSQQSFALNG